MIKPISTFISAGNRQVNSDIFHSTLLRQDGSVLPIEVCVFEQTVMDSKQTLLFVKDVTYFDNVLSKLSIIEKIFHSSNEAVMITDRHGYIHKSITAFQLLPAIQKKQRLLAKLQPF